MRGIRVVSTLLLAVAWLAAPPAAAAQGRDSIRFTVEDGMAVLSLLFPPEKRPAGEPGPAPLVEVANRHPYAGWPDAHGRGIRDDRFRSSPAVRDALQAALQRTVSEGRLRALCGRGPRPEPCQHAAGDATYSLSEPWSPGKDEVALHLLYSRLARMPTGDGDGAVLGFCYGERVWLRRTGERWTVSRRESTIRC